MKAQELRIGNITFDADGNVQVIDAIEILAIRQCEAASHPVEFIKPIPLTEDWLKRMGFKSTSEGYWSDGNLEVGYTTTDENMQYEYLSVNGLTEMTHLKYVHQLQNLFFSLCGKELTLTL
jgi:hypothetical protein